MSDNLTKNARSGNFCLASGAWATGSTATNVRQVTNPVAYVVAGQHVSRAGDAAGGINLVLSAADTADGQSAPFRSAASGVQAAGTTCIYAIGVTAAGALVAIKGDEVLIGSGLAPSIPQLPRSAAPAAYVRIVNTTNAFTFGVTAFNATGVTATYYNVFSELAEVPGGVA